jgi:hypothetical protein
MKLPSKKDSSSNSSISQNNVTFGKYIMAKLADNAQYINRTEIKSASSNRLYVVAQHRTTRGWSCSCPSWKVRRRCKHLETMGLPTNSQPFELEEMNNKNNKFLEGYKTDNSGKKGKPEDWAKELAIPEPKNVVPIAITHERKFNFDEE